MGARLMRALVYPRPHHARAVYALAVVGGAVLVASGSFRPTACALFALGWIGGVALATQLHRHLDLPRYEVIRRAVRTRSPKARTRSTDG